MALPMCWSLSASAAAQDGVAATHVPLESMTRTEYESYRSQLNQQMNGAVGNAAEQDATAAENASGKSGENPPEAKEDRSESGGYGKGYRARMERNSRTGRTGGFRGGSMSRGGGRNR